MRHLADAARRLRRQPGFAAAALGTLAMGIAAPTAMFAVVNATLLRPLPYTRADEIYAVRTAMTDGRFTIGLVASAEMNALRRSTDAVVQFGMAWQSEGTIETNDGVKQVTAYGVTQGFFDLFGLPMAYGRVFNEDDNTSWMGGRIVLSHRAWQNWYGGDPALVGKTVRYGGGPALVVGIAPAALAIPRGADLWFAMPPDDSIGHQFDAYVRLKPGVMPAAVQARLGPMWDDLAERYPDQETNRTFTMRPLLDTIVGDLGPIVVIAFAAAGLLLLLAMVNVANLLLARGTTRGRETAVRVALGATRAHLLRDLVAESSLLAIGATLVALPLTYAAVRTIVVIGGAALPRAEGMQLEAPVFVFAATAMVAAAFVVGLVPLLATRKPRLGDLMNEGGRGALLGRGTRRVLAGMVVAEVTLAIALVAGAGRLLLGMSHLVGIDPGFTASGRLAVDVYLPVRPYLVDPARVLAWLQQAQERLRVLGATKVGVASTLPLRHEWDSTVFVDITGHPTAPENRPNGRLRIVDPGFFDAMNMSIVSGRAFTVDDRAGGDSVVIVNQAWARKFLPGLDPLRERVSPGRFTMVDGKPVPLDAAIVGVARDVPYEDLTIPAEPTVYVPTAQVVRPRQTLVITTANGRPEDLIPQIRSEFARIDPQVPVDFASLSDVVAAAFRWPKLGLLVMATFGLAGLVLAATGVFGVIAFVAAQRSGEMAVRLALGATRGQVFGLMVRQGAVLSGFGLALGLGLAWWLGQLMTTYVYQVSAANPLVLGGSGALVLLVAVGATLPSARRAARTAPARALKV